MNSMRFILYVLFAASHFLYVTATRSCILRISPADWRPLSLKLNGMGLRLTPLSLSGYFEVNHVLDPSKDEDDTLLSQDEPSWLRRLQHLPEVIEVQPNHEKIKALRQARYNDLEWLNGHMPYWQKATNFVDIGINEAWKSYSGKGIRIAVLDDGVNTDHDDLRSKYDKINSYDYVRNKQSNVKPAYGYTHGTKVAGLALAERNNGVCGFGSAPDAQLVVVRVISSAFSTSTSRELEMFTGFNRHKATDIFLQAWGINDNGESVEGPTKAVLENIKRAASEGRGGLGSVIVVAAGNGGSNQDDCNCDGYINHRFSIAIQALTSNGSVPFYSEHCAAAVTSAIAGDLPNGLVTTVNSNLIGVPHCTRKFSGTSAAAPVVAGVIALALESNPKLTRRDITELVIDASEPDWTQNSENWTTNAEGKRFHPRFGFGILNAEKLVKLAVAATPGFTQTEAEEKVLLTGAYPNAFFEVNCHTTTVKSVEWVTIEADITATYRGGVSVKLISAQNTEIVLLSFRPKDKSTGGFHNWKFSTPAFWGEAPFGKWKVVIQNTSTQLDVTSLALYLYGRRQQKLGTPGPAQVRKTSSSSITLSYAVPQSQPELLRLCYRKHGGMWRFITIYDKSNPASGVGTHTFTLSGLEAKKQYDVALSWGRLNERNISCWGSCGAVETHETVLKVIDPCGGNPCGTDICIPLTLGHTCISKPHCSTFDHCLYSPCMNRATCTSSSTGYECHCAHGFTGRNCSVKVDWCNSNPCRNDGHCTSERSGYFCDCKAGYQGRDCSKRLACSFKPCLNGGHCEARGSDYTCQCTSEYTGSNCEHRVKPCSLRGCPKGYLCIEHATPRYSCLVSNEIG